MKHTIHTPTEQFGFVETEFDDTVLAGDATLLHKSIVEVAKPQEGIPSKEFDEILDLYLTTGNIPGDPGLMEKMSVAQVALLQAIKRSRKRTNQ